MRCRSHADRPLRRSAGQRAHRRSGCDADSRVDRAQPGRRLERRRRRRVRLRQPGGRGQPQRRPHGAPARRSADRSARHAPSIVFAARVSTPSPSPRARSDAARCRSAIAGGVESMSRAPFVIAKADSAFSRAARIEDTTIGWRFVNPAMKAKYGIDSMPETAENVAAEFGVGRADQDAFALRSQARAAAAIAAGPAGRGDRCRHHPREEGRRRGRHARRASSRNDAGSARETQRHRPPGRHRDRRQRLRGQRRQLRDAPRFRRRRAAPRAYTQSARDCRGGLQASRRESWASGRLLRCARHWRWRSSRSPTSMSSS